MEVSDYQRAWQTLNNRVAEAEAYGKEAAILVGALLNIVTNKLGITPEEWRRAVEESRRNLAHIEKRLDQSEAENQLERLRRFEGPPQ